LFVLEQLSGPVHTTPEEFENGALFLRLGLPSTLICHENGALRKRSSDRRNLKTPACVLVWAENILKTDDVTIIMGLPRLSFPQAQIQNDRFSLLVFKFPRRSVDGKHLTRFQSEAFVFKFLRRTVDGKHLMRFQSEASVFKFLRRGGDGKHLMRFESETSVFKFLRRSVDKA